MTVFPFLFQQILKLQKNNSYKLRPLSVSQIHRRMSGELPQSQAANNAVIAGSPIGQHKFLIPSPIPTRRTRTYSQSEKAKEGPTFKGKVEEFCRQKGHGFIVPEDGSGHIFVHISDVDGEYVPKAGDDVTYKRIKIPPKFEKMQAVHVQITHLAPGVSHETWSSSGPSPQASPRS